jgi:RHS repeat-associated protein
MPNLTLTLDVENRLVQSVHSSNGTERYVYDPSNQRVWKQEPSRTLVFFYGVEGNLLATYGDESNTDYNVYFGSKLVWAEASPGIAAGPVTPDRLGSTVRHFPYGSESTATGEDRVKFATYYRDQTSTLDYARNRYYSRSIARFTTPDPYGGSASPSNPQSWNRYAYVRSDPVNHNDPGGLDWWDPVSSACYPEGSIDPYSAIMAWYVQAPSGCYPAYSYPFSGATSPAPSSPLGLALSALSGLNIGGSVSYSWDSGNGALSLSFVDAETAVSACAAFPEVCAAVIFTGTVWVITVLAPKVPELVNIMNRGSTARANAPVRYYPESRGRNANGDCNPPDSDKYVKWRGTGDDHWHWIDWNQDPITCIAWPIYRDGPNDPGPKFHEIAR